MSTPATNRNDPTPAMIERCKAWLQVVETLEKYLTAAAQRYDWISEATGRLSRDMPQPEDLGDQFAPVGSGGIKDLISRLWWDLNLPDGKCADDASTVIKNKLMAEVKSLKADLQQSIQDFTELSASFDESTLTPTRTAQLRDPKLQSRISTFVNAVNVAESGKQPEIDPFLIKNALDTKIDSVVRKNNKQADSYAYVQDAAKKVDGAVVERVQALVKQYTDIAENNGKIIANGAHQVGTVFVNQPKLAEYKYWLQSSKAPQTFAGHLGATVKARESDSDLGYPKENSPYAKAIRAGALERRTRFLKNYAVSDYVLTPLSLIEMRHNEPVWSIDLLDAELVDDHKASSDDQFVIRARQHGSSSGKKHNWVFRARVATNWKRDLKALLSGSIPENLGSFYDSHKATAISPSESNTADKLGGLKVHDREVHDPFGDDASPSYTSTAGTAAPVSTAPATTASAAHAAPVATAAHAAPATTASTASVAPATTTSAAPVTTSIPATSAPATSAAAAPTTSSPAYSDSEVSDIDDTGYRSLHEENEDSLAWKAKRDMDVFDKPGSVESSVPSSVSASVPGSAAFPVKEGQADVWEYDAKNKDGGNTLRSDTNFQPADSTLPVEKERRLSQTNHKNEVPALLSTRATNTQDAGTPEEVLERRRSSVNLNLQRKGSRKATGSYGENDSLKPLSSVSPDQKDEKESNPLYFSSGLPKPGDN